MDPCRGVHRPVGVRDGQRRARVVRARWGIPVLLSEPKPRDEPEGSKLRVEGLNSS